MKYDIADIKLAREGKLRIEWAREFMPVLHLVKKRFMKEKPLKGTRISACLHVTTETANLVEVLKTGGAEVKLCASNPLSTQDNVAASLVKDSKIPVFAIKGEGKKRYYEHIESVLSMKPHITMDDGADLVSTLHSKRGSLINNVIGGTEETTTGVIRLRSMEDDKVLGYPIIAINDAKTKYLFDNRYGTGQSTIDGILRATNILLAGCNFVVCGYGWCGRGIARRAQGMGAHVIIAEVDSIRALEAAMDGYQVMSLQKAARKGNLFVTSTGDISVLRKEHFRLMKDGAILANAGHFNVEIDIPALEKMAKMKRNIRGAIYEYTFHNGKRINLLGEGRLINLAAAEGHPAMVMDMSFSNQVLSVEYMVKHGHSLAKKVYPVPEKIDRKIACLKLKSMGIKIDKLTKAQEKYLKSWEVGT